MSDWYKQILAGAEDMLGGMVSSDVGQLLSIDREELTDDQIKKIRDLSGGQYTPLEDKSNLFLKFPDISYYYLWDFSRYFRYNNVSGDMVQRLWDLLKKKNRIDHFPTLDDSFPEWIYEEVSENPNLVSNDYIWGQLSMVFRSPELYPDILFNSLKERFPEEYKRSTTPSEQDKITSFRDSILFPSNMGFDDT